MFLPANKFLCVVSRNCWSVKAAMQHKNCWWTIIICLTVLCWSFSCEREEGRGQAVLDVWMFAAVFVGWRWCGAQHCSGSLQSLQSLCYQETLQWELALPATAATAGSRPVPPTQINDCNHQSWQDWGGGGGGGQEKRRILYIWSRRALHTWHPRTPLTSRCQPTPAPAWALIVANLQAVFGKLINSKYTLAVQYSGLLGQPAFLIIQHHNINITFNKSINFNVWMNISKQYCHIQICKDF